MKAVKRNLFCGLLYINMYNVHVYGYGSGYAGGCRVEVCVFIQRNLKCHGNFKSVQPNW